MGVRAFFREGRGRSLALRDRLTDLRVETAIGGVGAERPEAEWFQ